MITKEHAESRQEVTRQFIKDLRELANAIEGDFRSHLKSVAELPPESQREIMDRLWGDRQMNVRTQGFRMAVVAALNAVGVGLDAGDRKHMSANVLIVPASGVKQ